MVFLNIGVEMTLLRSFSALVQSLSGHRRGDTWRARRSSPEVICGCGLSALNGIQSQKPMGVKPGSTPSSYHENVEPLAVSSGPDIGVVTDSEGSNGLTAARPVGARTDEARTQALV